MIKRSTKTTRRLVGRGSLALLIAAASSGAAMAGGTPAAAVATAHRPGHATLARPDSLRALHARSVSEHRPVVALFSTPGCPWCEAIRREQLQHLARDATARGVLVVELDMTDRRPFPDARARSGEAGAQTPAWAMAGSPAELARLLGVRVAPTLAFLGTAGEVAPPLVGYTSPDFFGAYLDDRIEQARAAMGVR